MQFLRRAMSGSPYTGRAAVDVHTHVYLPSYMELMRGRSTVPMVRRVDGIDRLIILPGEADEPSTSSGRPVGSEYYDVSRKLRFMDTHGIQVSVLSLANPWIDFLSREQAPDAARALNDEMQRVCEASHGRFYGFGVLPTQDPDACARELERLAGMDRMRGVILSTRGRGNVRCMQI